MKQSPVTAIQLLWVNLIMDSLAAMALATGSPGDDLLERPPQNRDDYLVSRRMVKHIMYGSIWQAVILCVVAFAGEHILPEANVMLRYNYQHKTTIYPGRLVDWPWYNLDPLFEQWHKGRTVTRDETKGEVGIMTEKAFDTIAASLGCCTMDANNVVDCSAVQWIEFPKAYSHHFTFFFNLFVFFQIMNMICARKIHDEWNIFEGFFTNIVFLAVWGLIVIMQIGLTWARTIFKVEPLTW